MKKYLLKSISLIAIILLNHLTSWGQSSATLTSTSPVTNSSNGALTANVSATFNDFMVAPSASNSAMRVFGNKRGAYSYTGGGTYSGVNTATITYNPTRTFLPGELLSLINNANTTNGIINSRPTNSQFWAAAGVGKAQFSASTSSSLSLGSPDRDLNEIQNADLDNDGDLDIVFSRTNQFGGASISYALNNGAGAFGAASTLIEGGPCCFGNYVTSFTTGDYNHDGRVDIAVSYSVTDAGTSYYLARFLNNGFAVFSQFDYSKTEQYDEMISADMDADGDIDIVGVNRAAGNIVLNPNNGSFGLANVVIATISGVYSIVAGDFNGDRRMDIASTRSTSNFIRISLQPATGTTYTTIGYNAGTSVLLSKIKILDLEGDGDLDVAALNATDGLVVFMQNTAGALSTPTTVAAAGMSNFDLADYDGDGDFDLGFAAGNNSLQIYKNTAGVFSSFSTLSLGIGAINNVNQMCSGDFDGDGDIDVVGKPPVQSPSFGYPLRLLKNNNDQVFTNAVTSPTCVGNQITVSWTVSTTLVATNDYFIQLSDASGSFASPIFLGSVFNSGVAGSQVVTIPNVTPGNGYRIRVFSNTAGVNSNDNGSNIQILAGIDISVSSFCDINSSYLSANSATSGVTYSWSPATGLDVTTGADVVASPSTTTTYYVTGTSPLGCVDVDTIIVQPSCYCATINITGNCNAVNITQVTINSLSNSSACSNLNGTAYNIYPATGNTTTSLVIGNTYSFSVRNGGTSNCTKVAWFDWDGSGTFDASEFVNLGSNIPVNTTTTVSVTIPATASAGLTGVRVREVLNGTTIGSGNSCTQYSTGETEDYFVTLDLPQVTGLAAVQNDNCYTTTSNLVYTFNTPMSATATAAANYKINGFKKGIYSAVASGANTNTITYNPTVNFKPGERIMVTLTTNLQSTNAVNMAKPLVYEFLAKAGVGPATFLSEPLSGNTAGTSGDIGVADFTGDGNLDFVITITGVSSTTLQFFTGNGAGGFTAPTNLTTPQTNPLSIEPADWDNDGDMDFIVGYNNVSAPQVTLYRNNGTGTFTQVAIALGTSSGLDIASADYDGDGDLDLVTVNAAGTDINFVRNNGAGSFTLVDLTNTSTNNFIVVPGDFNGDDIYDIAVADITNNQIDIYTLKIGSGFSLRNQINTSGLISSLKTNDFDGDGVLDFVWTQLFTDSVGFAHGNGDFTFTNPFYYSLTDPSQMEVADYDGDCDLDLAISSTTGDLYIMKNDGSGNFTNQIGQSGGFSPVLVKSGDFDGDADIDLIAIRNSSNTASFLRNALLTITTGAISGPICNSPSISIPWTANTTLTNVAVNVELSDALGSFATPTVLLNTTISGASGTISGVPIPIVTAAIGYRIRVIPTSISASVIDNGTNLGIGVSPNLNITSSCSGNNTLLNLTGATTYTWSPVAGLSSSTAANVTAAPSAPTVYTYFGKDAAGCQSINYTVSVSDKCYCYPQYTNLCSSGDYISNVTLNTLNNSTNACSGNQFNFTAVPATTSSTTLTRGSSYNLSVTPNGGSFAQGIGVWIDFNQDNDYDDAGEFVFSSAPTLVTVSTSVFVPLTANLGLTRVRVRAMYNVTPLAANACSATNFGESEDYIVTIACSSPIVYNVTGGGVICDGVGVSVGLSNSENTTNYTLYFNGVSQTSLQGTGSSISFNSLTAVGSYTIQAISASGCSASMNGIASISGGTALEVSSTSPVSNNASIATTSNINTTFNTSPAVAAASQIYFKVYGKQTGIKGGAYSVVGGTSLRLNPTVDFKPGEEIDVVHVNGTPGQVCTLDTGYVYRLTAKAGVGPATFNPYNNPIISGSIITGVTEGDFNNDGKVDYAFIARNSNNISVAINSGTGNFSTPTSIALTGYQPSKIEKGDFDNDGDIDLVIGALNSGVIRLYKNNGLGAFSLFSTNNSAYTSNSDIEVADFNLDGFLDVVVTAGTGSIQILKNDGASTLVAMSIINSSFNHRNIAIIDINKDGMPDVVATNTGDSFIDFFENNQNALGLLSANGTYSLNTGIGATGLNDIVVKDFDNDNDEDIVVGSISTGRIAVVKNNYPAISTVAPSVLVNSQAFKIITGDFDGDADIDLVVSDSASSNTFTLLKNTAGIFATAVSGTSYNAKYIAAADFDNDSDIDLVGVDFNGNNAFIKNEAVYITTVTSVVSSPVCAGSNLVVNWSNNQTFPAGNIFTVELSDANGLFTTPVILGTLTSQNGTSLTVTIPNSITFGSDYQVRVTSNSTPSLAIPIDSITIYDYPEVFNVTGGGLFCGDPLNLGIDGSNETMSFDVYFNGTPLSGYQDIPGTGTAMNLGSFTNPGTYTVIGINSGTGCSAAMSGSFTLTGGTEPVLTSVTPIQNSININRNSNIDITFNTAMAAISSYTLGVPIYVWGDKTGLISGSWTLPSSNVMRFDPTNNFKPGETISITVTNSVSGSTGCSFDSNFVFTFTVKGAVAPYNFVEQYSYSDGNTSSNKPVVADLNGDNILDVAYMSDDASIYKLNVKLGLGLGALGTTNSLSTTGYPQYLGAADFDNDGDLDMYTVGNLDILIYENDGLGNFAESSTGIFTDLVTPTVADFNGDGYLDILANEFNSGISVIYINIGGLNFTSFNSVSSYFFGVIHFHADFDNDGDEDFGLLMPLNNQVRFYSNTGGILTLEQTIAFTNLTSDPVVVNDFNGDQRPDVYFRRSTTGDVTLINNGSFGFTTVNNVNPFTLSAAGAADYDGDGDLDIPGANSSSNVAKGLNNGAGSFTYNSQTTTLSASYAGYGDMDGDFDIDMVTIGGNGQVLVLLNQPASSINTVYTGSTNLCPSQVITVSYNASGTFNAGNNFIVQLSDASGSFSSPTQIGIITSTALSGNISCTIPAVIANGSNYLIRVISNNPALNGSSTVALTITNFVTPTVSISKSPAGAQCAGTSLTFTATPVNGGTTPSYQWFLGASPISGANSSTYVTSSLTNGNQISCQMTSSLTCVTGVATSNIINVNVTTPSVVSVSIAASPTGSQCAGTTITYTATPVNGGSTPTYQWKVNGIAVGSNLTTYSSSSLNNGDIVTCELTSNATCVASNTVASNAIVQSITTPLVASVSIGLSPSTPQCVGTSLTFTATPINGGTTPIYQWFNNGSPITGANAATYVNSSLNDGDDITVTMATNACALPLTSTSNSVSVSILPTLVPSVSITASSNSICPGTNVVFTATPVNGGTTPVYEWRVNGIAQSGFTGNTFNSSTLNNGDIVRVRLTSSATCANPLNVLSGTITMIVNPTLVPSVAVSPSASSVCAGGNVVFTATPTNGGSTPIYQWFVNGSPVGINQNTYSTSSLAGGEVVTVSLTSNALCAAPTTVTGTSSAVTINPLLVPSVLVTASSTSICVGSSVLFTAIPTNGGASPSYQWRINGVNVGGATNSTFNTSSLNNGDNVTVRIVSSDLCASPNNATSLPTIITVNPLLTPTVSISSNLGNAICDGQIVSYSANITNGGSSPAYQWKINGTDVAGATSATFNSSTIVNGDVVSLNLTSNATCASPTSVLSSGITMTVNPILVPTVSISTPVTTNCESTSITFSSNTTNQGAAPSYQWNINGNPISGANGSSLNTLVDNGDVVTLTLTSNAVCAVPATVTSNGINMFTNPLLTPTVTIAALPGDIICNGENVTFTATPAAQGVSPTYNWLINGVVVQSGSSTVFNTSTLNNGDVVSCELISSETCVTSSNALSGQINMTVNTLPSTSIISGPTSPSCNAAGQVYSVTLTPGSTYSWTVPTGATIVSGASGPDNNSITVNFSNISGNITVIETSANGCIGTAQTLSIALFGCGVVIDFNANNTTVCAGQTVTYTSAVTGGIGATDLNWDFGPGAIPATITGNGPHIVTYNTPGLVSVTLTLSGDVNGSLTKPNYIQVFPQATDMAITATDAACGINNGSIQITGVTGGQSPYNYEINGGGLSATTLYSGLSSGNYAVSVVDFNGCVYAENVTINGFGAPTAIATTVNNATCGNPSGSITVDGVTGGTPGYLYNIDGGAFGSNNSFFGLTGGNYTVGVKDAMGCIYTQLVNVNGLAGPSGLSFNITDETCSQANGSVAVNFTLGAGALFSVTFNGVSSLNTNYSGLTGGSYFVTVLDVNGCSISSSAVVNASPAITSITTSITNATCGSNNGSINVTGVTGGTAGYTYSLDGSAYVGTTLFSGLSAGSYTIFVKDANNCVYSQGFNINNVGGVSSITTTINDATCGSNNGSINVTGVTGGTAGYTYSLDGSAYVGTTLFSGLSAGGYTIFVKDANNCVYSQGFNINNVGGVSSITSNIVDATCGSNNGSINVTGVTGGTAGYTYSLDGSAYVGTTLFSGLSAGGYTIFVKDANNCVYSQGFNINNVGGVSSITTTINDATCGSNNGSINVTGVTGGTAGYTYSLDGSAYVGTTLFSGLSAGSYTIFVKDANNCVYSQGFNINNVGGVSSITTTINDATCGSNNGSINVTGVTGGTAGYTYSLDGSAYVGTTLFSGLSAGSYTIFVKDANNCVYSQGFNINNTGGPSAVATTVVNENCGNGAGSVIITGVTGGVAPYTYDFDGSGFSGNTNYFGLVAGTYNLTVQDNNLCSFITTVTIGNNAGPTGFNVSVTDANCGSSDGAITIITTAGGTAPYTYSDDGINFFVSNQFTGLNAGIYSVYVQDNNGCLINQSVTVGNIGSLTVSLTSTDETCSLLNGSISASINGGSSPYDILWSNGEFTSDIFNLSAGTYTITVTDAFGCIGLASATINNNIMSLSGIVTDATCGNNDGQIDLTVVGGDGVYTYSWNNGDVNEDLNNIVSGFYDVFVNDNSGCTATTSFTIGDTPGIVGFITSSVDATCGSNNGSINVTNVFGGSIPYEYYIDGVSQSNNNIFTGLSSGSYLIQVQDNLGCEYDSTVIINTTPAITSVSTTVQNETCGELNGSVTIGAVVGGAAPYTYSFNGSAFTSQTFYTGLNNGIYNYEVLDNLGCNYTGSVTVASIGAVTAITTLITPETCGSANGSIEITSAVGGTTPYEYALNSGPYSLTPIFSGLVAGNDTIKVKDNIGCIFQQIVTVGGTPAAVANAGADITVCENTSVTLTATGGVLFTWNNGLPSSNSVNFIATATTDYIVQVEDANGCTDTDTVTVFVNPLPLAPVITASGPTTFCFGNSVDLASNYVGGNVWSTAASSDNININSVGNYSIDVTYTDANGCSATSLPTNVTVNALPATPVITANGPTTFCFGNSVDLTSNYVGGNTWSTSASSDTININGIGIYSIDVTQTDANGCSSTSAPISVTVNALPAAPVITASGPTTFCFGNSVDLTSSYIGGNVWSTTATSDNININTVGNYTIDVTYTDANGCSAISLPTTVTVNALPATPVITASGPTTFCFGNSVDLTSSYVGGNVWSTTATSDNINISAIGVYTIDVTQTDANGCSSTSAPISVTVNALPAAPVITASGPTTICFGSSVDLTSSYVGGNVWSTTATSDNININAVGNYTIDVTYTDANGCSAISLPTTVTVNALPATPVITASGPTTFCFGNSVDLTSSYIGGNVWSTTATSDNINISAIGVYTIDVTQTDGNGCSSTSAPISVTVNALPAVPVITASGPTTFCFGNSVDLTSNYVGGNVWSTSATSDNINIIAVGNYNIDVTHTDANGCSATSLPTAVTVNALPAQPVITAFGSLVICNGNTVTLASNEANGNLWNSSETTQSIVVSSAGSYTVTYTDINGCSQVSDAVQVNVNTPIPANLNLVASLACEGTGPVALSGGLPAGGNYIGSGVINNIMYPALLPGGVYNIDYIVNDANGCTSVASQNFTINSAPVVLASAAQTVLCLNDAPTILSGTPVGGLFSGSGITGSNFDPSIAGAGIHPISYQYTDLNGCSSTSNFNIIVNPLPQLTLLPVSNLCMNSGTYSLNNGFPAGGTYLIDGTPATEINTNILSAGLHTLTYNYNPAAGCGNSISTQFTINATPTVTLTAFADICETASPFILTGGLPNGGIYSGSGVLGGVFYPNLANSTNVINYTYTDVNGCNAVATQNLTVLSPQAINFPPLSPICLNAGSIVLNGATPVGGNYSGVGVVSNNFDPVIAGVGVHTINYQVTDINGCLSTSNQTITVNALPVLSTVSIPSICSNSNAINLSFAQPVGGTYIGTAVNNGLFDPALSGNGTFNLLYVFTDNNTCTDTVNQNITVNAAPIVTQTNYSASCGNAGLITLNNGLPAGGVYSGAFVSNGLFNSDISGAGTFIINYTFTDNNGCAGTANADLVVNPLPFVTLGTLGNICSGSGSITLNNGLPLGGTYFGTGVSNGILDPSVIPSGTQTLGYTYTDANGCIDSTSISYNIYNLQANAGIDQSITCVTSALLQGQSNYSGIGTLNYSWSPAIGLSSTNTQNTVATPSVSTNYILTVSDGVCSSNDTVIVLVSQPNFNLSVTPSAQILNAAPFIVFLTNNTPNPSNYSFVWDFGDGTTYNGFQPVYHNYTSNGSFTVTLIATALGSGCVDTLVMSNLITCNNGIFCNDSANVIIDGVLIPNNSNYSTTICANQNFLLSCNTGANYSYQWYYNGVPLQSGLGSTYSPTVTGYYTIGVENNNCINLSSPVYVIVLPTPNIPFITSSGSNNFCGGGSLTLSASAGYASYLWSTGSTQSSITINTSGNYWVQGFDANGCFAQSLDFAVNGSNMLPQYICVATVDTLLNENRIIWEKPITTSIDSFVVYRESSLAGVYNEIGRVAYEDNSEFIDTASSPDINNNRYRLAIKDSCGNMTTQGDIHGTIKTWITPLGSGDSLEIFFTKYIGIDSLSYSLYRGASLNAMAPVGSAYTFNSNANFYSIKDLSPPAYPSGYVYYQVRANLDQICNSDSNTYHQSISNTISYGNALGIENGNQQFEVNAFPNPNNGSFNISIESALNENVNLVIYNQIGEVVWMKQVEKLNGKTIIYVPLEQAAQGVYQLQVTSNKKISNKRLIINK